MEVVEKNHKKFSKYIKIILQVGFFLGLTIFSLIYIFIDKPGETLSYISEAAFWPLVGAILFFLLTLVTDGAELTLLSRLYMKKYKFSQGVINVCTSQLIGVYVKSAVPAVEAYTFSKQEVKGPHAASIVTMSFLMYQSTLCIYSSLVTILGWGQLKDVSISLGGLGSLPLWAITLFSLGTQLLFLGVILALAFWRGLHRLVLNSFINFLAKIHILKQPENTRIKLTVQFATYRIEMKRLFQHPFIILFSFTMNLIKRCIYAILPYMILFSLKADMSLLPFYPTFIATGWINTISCFLTSGAPEVCFYNVFASSLFLGEGGASVVRAANVLWRSITFYFPLVIGAISMALYRGVPKKYELRSDTATIYDLEISSLGDIDEDTREYLDEIKVEGKQEYPALLSQQEVQDTFEKIRASLIENPSMMTMEKSDEKLEKTLEEQRKHLADVAKETDDLLKASRPDEEIQKEADHELEIQKRKQDSRKLKKEQKRKERALRRYQKMLPKGSVFEENEEGHILYKTPVIEIHDELDESEDEK